jgi:hypothetical protein
MNGTLKREGGDFLSLLLEGPARPSVHTLELSFSIERSSVPLFYPNKIWMKYPYVKSLSLTLDAPHKKLCRFFLLCWDSLIQLERLELDLEYREELEDKHLLPTFQGVQSKEFKKGEVITSKMCLSLHVVRMINIFCDSSTSALKFQDDFEQLLLPTFQGFQDDLERPPPTFQGFKSNGFKGEILK